MRNCSRELVGRISRMKAQLDTLPLAGHLGSPAREKIRELHRIGGHKHRDMAAPSSTDWKGGKIGEAQ